MRLPRFALRNDRVGNLKFDYDDVYCALCPEDAMADFEKKFTELTFIDPNWGINQILDKLIKKAHAPDELPF